MDAGNMLKPLLARGELRMVGADDAGRVPRADREGPGAGAPLPAGVCRRAQRRGHHRHPPRAQGALRGPPQVEIEDAALVAAASLSDRFISGRQLPDKAIDLVDEAASRLRMEIDSSPVEIDQLRRAVDRLTMEELHLAQGERRGLGRAARPTAQGPRRQDRRARRAQRPVGGREVRAQPGRRASGAVDDLRTQAERLQRDGDYAAASKLLYGDIPALERELAAASEAEAAAGRGDQMVKERVGADDIAEVISAWTGIPAGRILQGETEKLLSMESLIGARLIGQGPRCGPSRTPSGARGRASPTPTGPPGPSCSSAPPASARPSSFALADFLFDDERAMVRIDMSEYSEAARRGPAHRCASRLRRLRGGWPAHRGGPAPALLRRPARRGREGPSGDLRHPPPGARRRPADRRPGPHGRLPAMSSSS